MLHTAYPVVCRVMLKSQMQRQLLLLLLRVFSAVCHHTTFTFVDYSLYLRGHLGKKGQMQSFYPGAVFENTYFVFTLEAKDFKGINHRQRGLFNGYFYSVEIQTLQLL